MAVKQNAKINVITDSAVKVEPVDEVVETKEEEVQESASITVTPVVAVPDVLICPAVTFEAQYGSKRYRFIAGKEMRVPPHIKEILTAQGALKVL